MAKGFAVKGSGVRGAIWCPGVCIQQRGKSSSISVADVTSQRRRPWYNHRSRKAEQVPSRLQRKETHTLVPAGGSDAGGCRALPTQHTSGPQTEGVCCTHGEGGCGRRKENFKVSVLDEYGQVSMDGRDRLRLRSTVVSLWSIGKEGVGKPGRHPEMGGHGRRRTFALKHQRS